LSFRFRLFFGLLLCAEKQLFLDGIGDAGHRLLESFISAFQRYTWYAEFALMRLWKAKLNSMFQNLWFLAFNKLDLNLDFGNAA
jgi:hypothetical protein